MFHLVMFHMHCTSCLSWQFVQVYSFFLFPYERPLRRVLLYRTYIVGIWSGKIFALYTFDFDYPDTSLSRHYLTKQSIPDKRGLAYIKLFYK